MEPQHLQSPHSRAHPSRHSRAHPFVVPAKAGTHVTPTSPSRHSRPHPFVLPAKAGTHVTRTSPSVRPERREQVVHPAAKSDVQPAPEVEGHPPHPSHETTNPNLTSYPNAATKTTQTRPNTSPSYNPSRPSTPQPAQNHPQNRTPQLQHETNKTKLISYAHAAIETTSSYEKSFSSYGTGRTLANQPAKTTFTQIGDKTMTSKLNSYDHAATPIIPDPLSVIPAPLSVIPTPLSVIPTEGRNPNTPLTPSSPSVRPERRQSVVHPACQGQTYNRLPKSKDPAPDDPEWAEMSGNDTDSQISTLTFRQQAALPAVAMAPTLSQAARDSGVGLSTLRRWLQEPEFRQQLANFRQESADLARQQAQAILPRCLSVFAEVMECPDPSLRLRAARYAMAFALQITEAHDLNSRLQQLEQSIIPSTDA